MRIDAEPKEQDETSKRDRARTDRKGICGRLPGRRLPRRVVALVVGGAKVHELGAGGHPVRRGNAREPLFQGVRAAGPQSAAAAQERRHKCGLKAPTASLWAPASAAVR